MNGMAFQKNVCWLAVLLVSLLQVSGDHGSRAAFDHVTLDHMHQLSVFKEGNSRGRRRVRQQVSAGLFYRIQVETGKRSYGTAWFFTFCLQGLQYTRTGSTGAAATYGINNQQGSTFLGYSIVDLFGR